MSCAHVGMLRPIAARAMTDIAMVDLNMAGSPEKTPNALVDFKSEISNAAIHNHDTLTDLRRNQLNEHEQHDMQPQMSAMRTLSTLPIATPSSTLCHVLEASGSNAMELSRSTNATVSLASIVALRRLHARMMTIRAARNRTAAI